MAINFLNVGAFPDDVKLTFGAGSDLQIFHNATDSIIYNGTGALMLRGSDVRVQTADASTTYLTLGSTGATFGVHLIPSVDNTIDLGTTDSKDFRTLYIRNIDVYNQRIYIDSSGTLARFYDHPTVGDGIQFLHLGTEILRLGNGSSTTATFAGTLEIPDKLEHAGDDNTYLSFSAADNIKLVAGGKNYLHAHDNGNLYLYSNNSTALTLDATQTATFAGNVVINGADVDIASVIRHIGNTTTYFGFPADNEWRVVTSSTEAFKLDANQLATFAGDVQLAATKKLYLDGSNNTYIYESSDGVIDFYGDTVQLFTCKQNGTQSEVVVNEGSGDVDFRVESNNNTHAFFVDAASAGAAAVGGSNITYKFNVHEGDMFVGATSAVGGRGIYFQRTSATNAWSLLQGHNGTNAFELREGSDTRMYWDDGGKVGIGTIAPAAKLDVNGGIIAGGKTTYTISSASLTTTGTAVAGLSTGTNLQSSGFIFTCFGGDGFQRIVYSCRNESGTWNIDKDIDEGVNAFDVTYAADGSDNITFTFKSRSGTQSYTPKVTVEAVGDQINQSYIN